MKSRTFLSLAALLVVGAVQAQTPMSLSKYNDWLRNYTQTILVPRVTSTQFNGVGDLNEIGSILSRLIDALNAVEVDALEVTPPTELQRFHRAWGRLGQGVVPDLERALRAIKNPGADASTLGNLNIGARMDGMMKNLMREMDDAGFDYAKFNANKGFVRAPHLSVAEYEKALNQQAEKLTQSATRLQLFMGNKKTSDGMSKDSRRVAKKAFQGFASEMSAYRTLLLKIKPPKSLEGVHNYIANDLYVTFPKVMMSLGTAIQANDMAGVEKAANMITGVAEKFGIGLNQRLNKAGFKDAEFGTDFRLVRTDD
jgi:hypothetical protein